MRRYSHMGFLAGLAATSSMMALMPPSVEMRNVPLDKKERDPSIPKNEKYSRQRRRYLQRQARKRNRT